MYADDLILITRATRSAAKNINLCLSTYPLFSSKNLNVSKSQIFSHPGLTSMLLLVFVLSFSSLQLVFLFLIWVFLSPPKGSRLCRLPTLLIKSVGPVLDWNSLIPSQLPRLLWLIFQSFLSQFTICQSTLILSLSYARLLSWLGSFLHKGSDQKDIHVVTWTRLIDTKPEEGLAIKNLVTAKHALMAKHVFKFLNVDDVIWVDILCVKYGNFNFWKDSIPYKCSCFFWGLCNSAKILKPYIGLTLWIPTVLLSCFDRKCSEIPLAFKPTFLNINSDFTEMRVSDLICGNDLNYHSLHYLFGENAQFFFLFPWFNWFWFW